MKSPTPLFLDTSILVDRIIAKNDPGRIDPINSLLRGFGFLAASSYSRLEVKRVVIQNLALTLRYLIEEKSFFRALHRVTRLQRQRRVSTLVNVMAFIGLEATAKIEVTAGEDLDLKMALQAESYIRNAIRYLWRRFDKSVDTVLNKTMCVRATEGPELMKDGNFDVSIRESRCKDRQCNNSNFLRSFLPTVRRVCEELEQSKKKGIKLTDEIDEILTAFRRIEHDLDKAQDYQTCLQIGDLWLHLESAAGGIKHFCTRNYKESDILCPLLNLELKLP